MSQTRTCNNGVLSGSSAYNFLSCRNGCGSFGVDGTAKMGVIVGAISVPVTCKFGESGIFSVYNQVNDQRCSNGQIVTSNLRQGDIVTPGICPSYSWVGTANWTTCSANCGGSQTRIFECRDSYGQLAPADRCGGAAPVESRVCDGNPAAVGRTDVSTSIETATSTTTQCPKNQVGVTTSKRTITTTTVYACINHQVGVQSRTTVASPWQTQTTCRDIQVTYCEDDQLTKKEAEGRLGWMKKCRDKIPAVKEFMNEYHGFRTCGGYSMHSKTHKFYPTFIHKKDHGSHGHKHGGWKAPTHEGASCDVPDDVEVGAVCVPGGATPEMQILAAEDKKKQMQYVPFVEALLKKYKYVATPAIGHGKKHCDNGKHIGEHRNGKYDEHGHVSCRDDEDDDDSHHGHDRRGCKNSKHRHDQDHDDEGIRAKFVKASKVKSWITDKEDLDHSIVEFRLQSGRILRVTPNHPVLTEEGRMKQAGEFRAGEKLVQLGGDLDRIVSITNVAYRGKTYSVTVAPQDVRHNIIVTNGYLNGTDLFKYEDIADLNRALMRKKLTRDIFEEQKGHGGQKRGGKK